MKNFYIRILKEKCKIKRIRKNLFKIIAFNSNGTKSMQYYLLNGAIHGEAVLYDEVGKVTQKLHYSNGRLSGEYVFYKNGKKDYGGSYFNGAAIGLFEYRNGKKQYVRSG